MVSVATLQSKGGLPGIGAPITLWLCQNSYWKWPLIVDFPLNMLIFHSYVNVYQRVVSSMIFQGITNLPCSSGSSQACFHHSNPHDLSIGSHDFRWFSHVKSAISPSSLILLEGTSPLIASHRRFQIQRRVGRRIFLQSGGSAWTPGWYFC